MENLPEGGKVIKLISQFRNSIGLFGGSKSLVEQVESHKTNVRNGVVGETDQLRNDFIDVLAELAAEEVKIDKKLKSEPSEISRGELKSQIDKIEYKHKNLVSEDLSKISDEMQQVEADLEDNYNKIAADNIDVLRKEVNRVKQDEGNHFLEMCEKANEALNNGKDVDTVLGRIAEHVGDEAKETLIIAERVDRDWK